MCSEEKMTNILSHCHSSLYGGHFRANQTIAKVLQFRYYWPSLFKDFQAHVVTYDRFQKTRNISKRHQGPLTNILEVKLFDV